VGDDTQAQAQAARVEAMTAVMAKSTPDPTSTALAFLVKDAAITWVCAASPAASTALRAWHVVSVLRSSLPSADPRAELASMGKRRCDVGPHVLDEDLVEQCGCPKCQARRDRVRA
jgi:hypothetical protein